MRTVSIDVNGLESLAKTLHGLPENMRLKVSQPAVKASISKSAAAIYKLIPFSHKTRPGKFHYRDELISKVKGYKRTGAVVGLAGPRSKKAPHAHLVEEGTVDRFTNSRTDYTRVAVGVRHVLKNKQRIAKTIFRKVSAGSFIKDAGKQRLFRGRMPAFHPVQRGVDRSKSDVFRVLKTMIESGIRREFTAAKLSRGK